MKTKIRKHATSFISIVICAAILLGLPAQALAFDLTDTKWSFMRLSIATTGETLSEAHSLDETDELIRAYNPYTERAVLSFAVENTQPYAVEVWTRNGDDGLYDTDPRETLAGYLKGKYENPESESVFDGTTARYFKGYDGLLQTLIDVPEPEPYPDVNSKNFINVIEWDGEVVDGDGAPVTLSDNVEYVIVLQPLTPVPSSEPDDTEDPENLEESEDTDETEDTDESDDPEESPELPPPDGYLAVKIDRALPPKGLGAPTGASAPFNALSSLPGQHNINMVTGNYVYNNVDLAVAGPQLLAFTRTYNSTDGQSGILGAGWRTNYDYSLEVSELSARVNMPDGSRYDFAENYDGTYTAPEASDLTLEKSGGAFMMTDRSKTQYEFNEQGQITKITTLGGFETTFTYSNGDLTEITGRNGSLELTYDDGGHVTKVTASPDDRSVSYGYDANDNLTSFTNPQGQEFTYTYDGDHRLTAFTDGNKRLCLRLTYDSFGRVVQAFIGGSDTSCTLAYALETRATTATDATARQYTYIYDRDRNVTRVVKPAGEQTYVYENGRVVSETSPEHLTTAYTYDENGNMTSTTRPDGSGSRITYNADNLPTKVETINSSQQIVAAASYTYDERGNILTQTDKNETVTTYTYDENNNCVSSTDSQDKTTAYEYDDVGRLIKVTPPDGEATVMSYNEQGKLSSETTPLGFETKYEYNSAGYMTAMIDPLNNRTKYTVDANGRTTKMTDALDNETLYTYDTAGNLKTSTDPLGRVTEYTYDSENHLLSETDPNTGAVTYVYDDDGRVQSMTDALGSKWTYGYNNDGWQTELTDPFNNSLTGTYDSNGNMLTSKDARDGVTTFEYNTDGLVVKATNPMKGVRKFSYDNNGNVISATDENENTWIYTYDNKNNLTSAKDPLDKTTTYAYDDSGRLTEIKSASNVTQTFAYDLDGRVTKSIDGEGNITQYGYDKLARLTKVTYADETFIAYEYDALGRMTKYTDAAGNETTYDYDAAGQLTKYTDALGNETAYFYDKNGNLKSVTDALENETQYEYDKNNNVTKITDALAQTTDYTYDILNRLISAKDANGGVTEYVYDKNSNLTTLTNPDGGVLTYTYDANNRLITASDGYGESGSKLGYDDAGNITSIQDPLGNTTDLTYDKLGRNTAVTTPDGGMITYSYDDDGRVTKVTQKLDDEASAVTEYTYDKNNRIVKIEDALKHSRTVTYNSVGQLESETDENGNTSHYKYDANGSLIKYTDPTGSFTEYGYDELGRLISETAPRSGGAASTTTYAYDKLSRVTAITDALSRKTTLAYDTLGRINTVTDAKGGVTRYDYDKLGNIVKTTDALGNISAFEYDAMSRLTKATTPGGAATLYTYDSRGLITKIVDASRGEITAEYDANGNLTKETDGNGNITEHKYDSVNRVLKTTYGVGSDGAKSVTYAYNAAGRLVELEDWTGKTKLQSDLLGRLTKVTDPQARVTEYTWDNAGNRASIKSPDGNTVTTYAYNANNQLVSATTGSETTSYTYDGATRLSGVTLPNGEETRYVYDVLGQKTSEQHSKGGVNVRNYAYYYDELGRLTSETSNNIGVGIPQMPQETAEYRYDALGRLSQYKGKNGEKTDYTYDATGNLLREISSLSGETAYGYNAKNQLITKTAPDGAHAFTYDNSGKLIKETLNGDTIKALEYDITGRFVYGENAAGETTEYAYNGLGYRVGSTVTRANPNTAYSDSANSGGSAHIGSVEDTITAWDDAGFYTCFDASGKARQNEISVEIKTYVQDFTSGGLRDILISVEGLYDQTLTYGLDLISVTTVANADAEPSVQLSASKTLPQVYAHSNRLGGVSYLTDTDGKLVSYNEFDAWGNAYTAQPEDANYSGLGVLTGFTGYTWDAVLEVYFAQARLYDAGNKRFAQTDPVGGSIVTPLSLNPYLYCQNDPVDYIDPTGKYMPGDESLSTQKQAEIALLQTKWDAANAKGDTATMNSLHQQANGVRSRDDSSPAPKTPNSTSSGNTNSGTNSATYQQVQAVTAAWPPTPYKILVQEIAKVAPSLSLAEVFTTAANWTGFVNGLSSPGEIHAAVQNDIIRENPDMGLLREQPINLPNGKTGRADLLRSNTLNATIWEIKSITPSEITKGVKQIQNYATGLWRDIPVEIGRNEIPSNVFLYTSSKTGNSYSVEYTYYYSGVIGYSYNRLEKQNQPAAIPAPTPREEDTVSSKTEEQRSGQSAPGFASGPSLQDIITAIPNTGDNTPQWVADIFLWLDNSFN